MSDARLEQITKALSNLDERRVLDLVHEVMQGPVASLEMIRACERGMRLVGERYAQQEYFLSGLIMAGEIFREVMVIVQPGFEQETAEPDFEFEGQEASGKVLLGTVEGDIHNIGKNMLRMALRSFGFTVHDLGVDVAATRFAEEAKTFRPDVIGLSCLVSTSYDSMADTVTLLRENADTIGGAIPIVIGGGIIDEAVMQYVGADAWTTDAIEGVRICQALVSGLDAESVR